MKCVIAAGGLGTRLQNFRENKSTKILLEVNGTPMINHQIQQLNNWGFENFVIVTNPEYSSLIQDVVLKSFPNFDIKFSLIDRLLPKKTVSEIIDIVFRFCGQKTTVIFCDRLKDLGFKHAFKAGISFGKDDLLIPDNKEQLIDETKKLIADYEGQYAEGLITLSLIHI